MAFVSPCRKISCWLYPCLTKLFVTCGFICSCYVPSYFLLDVWYRTEYVAPATKCCSFKGCSGFQSLSSLQSAFHGHRVWWEPFGMFWRSPHHWGFLFFISAANPEQSATFPHRSPALPHPGLNKQQHHHSWRSGASAVPHLMYHVWAKIRFSPSLLLFLKVPFWLHYRAIMATSWHHFDYISTNSLSNKNRANDDG